MSTNNQSTKVNDSDLQKAREYASQIHKEMAESAFDDGYFAPHISEEYKHSYVEYHLNYAKEIEAGKRDTNFTIWQRMNYFLTDECVPFLPKT